jgi:hypothetical protein
MLAFLRKYQRIFIFIITFVIIVSFSFFGTQLDFGVKKNKDKRISYTILNKPVTLRQVQLLSNFLNAKWDDQESPNLFNDNVLVNDIIKSKLAKKLIEAYFEKLKPDLEKNFARIKKYKPYSHPKHEFLSAENIWNQFSPKLLQNYDKLKNYNEVNLDVLNCMTELFVAQDEFPPYLLKSILLNTQKRQSWIKPDPTLLHKNLALFGFKKPSDWFGKQFLDLVAQFIINASHFSSEKGYRASYDEAKMDLYKNFISALKKRKDFDKEKLDTYFSYQLNNLGMTEKEAIDLWGNILAFRKYFQSLTDSVILDQDIWPFKTTKADIESFQLPEYLKFKNFKDSLKLDVYLYAVAKKDLSNQLTLPDRYLSLAKVKKAFPEFVETKYKIIVKEVSQERLKAKIAMKDVWAWQLKDENWSKIKDKFTFINIDISTGEARFEKLKSLPQDKQNLLDDYTRDKILESKPDYLLTELNNAQEKELLIGISENRITEEFRGIESPIKLKEFFSKCDNEKFSEPYSENKRAYYQFKVIEKTSQEEIMTFERAKDINAIDIALEKFLKEKYLSIRNNFGQFKDADGNFKAFDSVIDDVGLVVFNEIYDALKANYSSYQGKGQNPLQFFSAIRLIPYMEKIYAEKDNAINQYIYEKTGSKLTLKEQWKLIKQNKSLHSKEINNSFLTTAFDLDELKFSKLGLVENSPLFFKLLSKNSEIDQEAIANKKNILSNELLANLADKIIKQMLEKDVVCFLGE